ncbi:protein-lysine N-methyltransferase SMYD4 [Nomia melanderi]|uniref:protein-lysine N-methyltransferase SMYD4 n=1 Tax=Nomia melanderi TaxID=2448451 RepID=UPI00130476A5|nr:SET and MYND domain-containing protein 4-like [Nomia melanderi]XP_031832591.1 SET and MYND domain-containing protein 4-like [Nomia melanderi]
MERIIGILNTKINANNKHQDVVQKFKSLSTDEKRVTFMLNLMLEYGVVPQSYSDTKNPKESEKFRELGNKEFVSDPLTNTSCTKALKLYTKSIAYAPCLSEQLALAYANRSAVLFKLHKYEECIKDIDRALSLSYPDRLRIKVYIRKVECLEVLKSSNIENTIKETEQWLQKMSFEDTNYKKLNDKLSFLKKTLGSRNFETQDIIKCETKYLLPKIDTYNTEIPCASSAISLKYNDQYGRHIVAARNINPGEVICIEKPYSLLLSIEKTYTHCSNCLEVCWANIPCNNCTYAMYCSEECKAVDWKKYHDIECLVVPSMLKLNLKDLDLFVLRLAIQAVRESSIQDLRKELEDVENEKDLRRKGFSKNGIFESNQYRSILSLVTNSEKRTVDDLFRKSLDACFTLYFLATCTDMFGSPLQKDLSVLMKNPDVLFVGSLILRHQQVIPSNMHTFTEEYGLDTITRGIAALPFCSLFNHSCSLNVMRLSRSKDLIIYVLCPIKQGEQIFDNYGDCHELNSKVERQRALSERYFFDCNCVACQEDWPLYYNMKPYASFVKNTKDLRKLNQTLRKFNTYVDIVTEGNTADKPYILNDLLKMIKILHKLVPTPCLEMLNVRETLKQVYCSQGNIFEIPKL